MFEDFSQNSKSFVRNSKLEIFGKFISLLNKNEFKKYNELLDFYVNIIMNLLIQIKKKLLLY